MKVWAFFVIKRKNKICHRKYLKGACLHAEVVIYRESFLPGRRFGT
jgi:hypothetical protein